MRTHLRPKSHANHVKACEAAEARGGTLCPKGSWLTTSSKEFRTCRTCSAPQDKSKHQADAGSEVDTSVEAPSHQMAPVYETFPPLTVERPVALQAPFGIGAPLAPLEPVATLRSYDQPWVRNQYSSSIRQTFPRFTWEEAGLPQPPNAIVPAPSLPPLAPEAAISNQGDSWTQNHQLPLVWQMFPPSTLEEAGLLQPRSDIESITKPLPPTEVNTRFEAQKQRSPTVRRTFPVFTYAEAGIPPPRSDMANTPIVSLEPLDNFDNPNDSWSTSGSAHREADGEQYQGADEPLHRR